MSTCVSLMPGILNWPLKKAFTYIGIESQLFHMGVWSKLELSEKSSWKEKK
jgi:hypothetical protein